MISISQCLTLVVTFIVLALNLKYTIAQIDTPELIRLFGDVQIKNKAFNQLKTNNPTKFLSLIEQLNSFNPNDLLERLDGLDFHSEKVNLMCSKKLSIWMNALRNRDLWALTGNYFFKSIFELGFKW